MTRRLVVAAVMWAAVTALAGPACDAALAHGETTPLIVTVVDGVSAAGVRASMVPGQPTDIALVNPTATDVTVVGDLGEPFLRVGRAGTYANVNSPTWYASGNPDGFALDMPKTARRGAPPRWMRVSRQPRWAWFDRRVQPRANPIPMQARQGRKRLRLVDWSIPIRYGARAAAIRGHVEYRPSVGAVVAKLAPSPPPAPGVSATVLGSTSPGLFVANGGPSTVTVLGSDDRPFARIGPRGVSVNVNSPTYAADRLASGAAPPAVAAGAAPRWHRVASVPRYGWVDPRLRYASLEPPQDVVRRDRAVVLKRWSVPIETSAGRRALEGTTSWIPLAQSGLRTAPAGGSGGRLLAWLLAGVALALGAGAVALRLRRRQDLLPQRARQTG